MNNNIILIPLVLILLAFYLLQKYNERTVVLKDLKHNVRQFHENEINQHQQYINNTINNNADSDSSDNNSVISENSSENSSDNSSDNSSIHSDESDIYSETSDIDNNTTLNLGKNERDSGIITPNNLSHKSINLPNYIPYEPDIIFNNFKRDNNYLNLSNKRLNNHNIIMEYSNIKMEREPATEVKEAFPYHYQVPNMDETNWLGEPGKFARTLLNTK